MEVVDWSKHERLHFKTNMLGEVHREERGKSTAVSMSEPPGLVYVPLVARYPSWAAVPKTWWPYSALNEGVMVKLQCSSQLPKEM